MALLFDGSSQFLTNSTTPLTAVPMTMACWFNCGDNTVQQTLISIDDIAGTSDELEIGVDGSVAGKPVTASARRTSSSTASSTTGLTLNTWHHAAGVFAGATDRRAFIDGGSKGTSATSKVPTGLDNVNIGARNRLGGGTNFFNGSIAEVCIWTAALSDGEIAALAKGFSPLRTRPDALVLYVPMITAASPSPDYTNGARVMSFTGNPTLSTTVPPRLGPRFAFSDPIPRAMSNIVTPVISGSLNPSAGSVDGGTVVTITFTTPPTSPFTVKFAGTLGTSLTDQGGNVWIVTTPVHIAGAVDVLITGNDGGALTLTGGYTYTANQVGTPVRKKLILGIG